LWMHLNDLPKERVQIAPRTSKELALHSFLWWSLLSKWCPINILKRNQIICFVTKWRTGSDKLWECLTACKALTGIQL
jgi:hypothetical protein